jgi:CheY-like chemotaxis protein
MIQPHSEFMTVHVDRDKERKERVLLIVEDDGEMRSLLCDGLWDLGLSIREAGDGDEALRTVLESCPDVIVTDLRMPAGGLDYVARLRTFAPQVPIILMTSFGDAQTKAEAFALGIAAYFDKPLRMSDLRAKVQQILGHSPTPLQPGARPGP